MANTYKNLMKRIFLYFSTIVFVLFIFSLLFAYIYEDEIKDITIQQINNHINTKIKVDKIELSLFNQFPNVALSFKNVSIREKNNDSLTIIKAEKIFLNFDIIDVIKGNYNLNNIVIDNAMANFIIYSDGSNNFNFISSNNSDSSNYFINLSSVNINNTVFKYTNKSTKQQATILIKKSKFDGVFSPNNFNITLEGKNIIKSYSNNNRTILKNKYIDLNVQLLIDPKTGTYNLEKGTLIYQGIPLNLSGNIVLYKNSIGINAKLIANNIPAKKIIKNLPKDRKNIIESYKPKGELNIKVNINGKLGGKHIPLVNIFAKLNSFSFILPNYNIEFHKFSTILNYSNGSSHNIYSSSLQIKKLITESSIGSISADIQINNFWKPSIKTIIHSNLDLLKLKNIIDIDTIKSISGNANINTELHFNLNINDSNKWNIYNISMSNIFEIKNASITFNNTKIHYDSIFCNGNLNNTNLYLQKINLINNNTHLKGNLRVINLPIDIFNTTNKKLIVKGRISADIISYKQILAALPKSNSKDSRFSDNIIANITFSFNTFHYNTLIADNATGLFSMSNRRISLRNIKLKSFNGEINSNVFIEGVNQGRYNIKSQGKLQNIDIKSMFEEFNNFGQSTLTSDNISGNLNSNYILNMDFDKDWNINKKSIELNTDISIYNGILKNMKSLNALKSYTKIDDFSIIKFNEIKNSISIKNSIITIPNMDIHSDKMGISLNGIHNFNNEYEYHISVLLSEIMGKKYNKTLTTEFGEIENDVSNRSKLFFTITGKDQNFKVAYDKSGLSKEIKKNLTVEKNSLKDALNKEFGWFKKDDEKRKQDSLKAIKKKSKDDIPKAGNGFSIDWDEDEDLNGQK